MGKKIFASSVEVVGFGVGGCWEKSLGRDLFGVANDIICLPLCFQGMELIR